MVIGLSVLCLVPLHFNPLYTPLAPTAGAWYYVSRKVTEPTWGKQDEG